MMQHVKLLVMSVFLTLMIWVMADYSLSDTATLQVFVEPRSTMEQMRVGLADSGRLQPNVEIDLRVSGKIAVITTLKSREPLLVELPIGMRDPGTYTLDVLSALTDVADFRELVLQEATPASLEIEVDRDVTHAMPVRLVAGSLTFEEPPVIKPAEVQVTMSERVFQALDPAERYVELRLEDYMSRRTSRSQQVTDKIPVRPAVGSVGEPVTRLEPDWVTISFKLVETLIEATLEAVPLKIEASMALFNGYRVELPSGSTILTQAIRIKGPAETIEQIRSNQIKVWGVIGLTADDKAAMGKPRFYTPKFQLPPDVTLLSQPEQVEFLLQPQPGEEPSGS